MGETELKGDRKPKPHHTLPRIPANHTAPLNGFLVVLMSRAEMSLEKQTPPPPQNTGL